jgi:hypothetical protein
MTAQYPQPFFRKLKGYAFDPSFSSTLNKRHGNEVIYKVKWEEVSPGPIGEYIEIIDYDPTKNCYYLPIDLNDGFVLADHGMEPSESDPRFHQQQVYAVVMSVIKQFERALGRKIIWSRLTEKKNKNDNTIYTHEFIPQLRIYPHAMRQQNAYYSPEKNALLFGYFQASNSWQGNNVPGGAIFTCLSPDIISHETTHAILHSLHPYLTRDTNYDMLAFHEGFADIIALLQRFTFRSVVEDQIKNSRGDLLSPENMLGDLAIQFGQAVSDNRRSLRSFLVEKDKDGKWTHINPDPSKIHTVTEPHKRGGILVAAVFDAFANLYRYRTADLIRLASDGTGILEQGEIDPDLVKRLSSEACDIADNLMMVCIRALDYCPPADLSFGDYLRALITADIEHNPDDEGGLRFAVMESFRKWGIIPDEVNTFSVESLKWKAPDTYFTNSAKSTDLSKTIKYIFDASYGGKMNDNINDVLKSIERILRENDRSIIFEETQNLSAIVHNMFNYKLQNIVTPGTETILGMDFNTITYRHTETDTAGNEKTITLKAMARNSFQVYKCRPMIISDSKSGNARKVMVIMFLQKVYVNLKGSPYQGFFPEDKYAFRGGSSLIIDMANYEVKYAVCKSVRGSERLFKQLDYALATLSDADNAALLMQGSEPFACLHNH